jgi:photosystem II stability/assembly factor-like uncharacterized protein
VAESRDKEILIDHPPIDCHAIPHYFYNTANEYLFVNSNTCVQSEDENMSDYLYLATTNGLFIARRDGGIWGTTGQALPGLNVTSVVVCEGLILAGTTDGVFRSVDGGRTWSEADNTLSTRHVRWLACSPEVAAYVLVGTEPASIFVSRDRAVTWSACPEVGELRDAHGWFLPYSPEAGCVRGFAVARPGANRARVFAAVEVGGVLVSNDSGSTWQLVEGSDGKPDMNRQLGTLIHPDVHSITVHPSSDDLVTAPTGGGLYRSTDGGTTWSCLYRCYCRAVWVDPADPAHIIFGPADGVSRNGRVEESRDGGQTWHPASTGMEVPWPKHMVERFVQAGKELLAVLSNGELWSTQLEMVEWHRLLPNVNHITGVATGN